MKNNSFIKRFFKNKLDERQEQELLRIEHRGFWALYAAIFVVYLIEIVMQCDPVSISLTAAVILAVSVYVGVACIKKGIWSRYQSEPSIKMNVLESLAGGAVIFIMTILIFVRNGLIYEYTLASVLLALLPALIMAGLCFAALQATASALKKKREKQQHEMDEEE